jgi:predicted ArsR family transcriptional regulator
MIAKKLNISWNTAQIHLYKLMADKLVRGKKVGRQNQWALIGWKADKDENLNSSKIR